MSKAKEIIEPESARKPTGAHNAPNGTIVPVIRPTNNIDFPTPNLAADFDMEVDDDYQQSADEPEIQWRRQFYDGGSTYPSIPLPHRSMKALDSASLKGSTRSLYESDLDYYIENNRRYVSDYSQPNDDDEQLRMQIMHQVFLFLLKSQLTSVPLVNPTKIIDIGTGTGDWVIGTSEAFPNAEVIGTDLSAIQPSAVPPNAFFEIFDAEDEDEWTYPHDAFDLIHFRNMAGSFNSWANMYKRVFAHLKPGGWIEVVDFDDQSNVFSKYFNKDSEMYKWYMALGEASVRSGKDVGSAHLTPQKLSAAGFVDVKVTSHKLPMGVWPDEPEARSAAKLWLVACLAGFESVSLRLLTRDLGWEPEEVLRMCRNMEAALKALALDKDKAQGLSVSVKILLGRKPFSVEGVPLEVDENEGLESDDAQPEVKRIKIGSATRGEEEEQQRRRLAPSLSTNGRTEIDLTAAAATSFKPTTGKDSEMSERP